MTNRDYITIQTADKIEISYYIASPLIRLLSFFMDNLIYITVYTAIIIIFYYLNITSYFSRLFNSDITESILVFAIFIVVFFLRWWYYIIFELIFNGKTPGKFIFRLRVVKYDGDFLDFSSIVLRNFVRLFDQDLTFFLGALFSMVFTKEFRRIGDIIAGTIVVRDDKIQKNTPDFKLNKITNEVIKKASNMDTLIKKLNENQLYILRKFLNSEEKFNHGKKDKIAKYLAEKIKDKLNDSEEITDPIEYLKTVYMRHNDDK